VLATDINSSFTINGKAIQSGPLPGQMQMIEASLVEFTAGENTLVIESRYIKLLDEITIVPYDRIPFEKVPFTIPLVQDGKLIHEANVLGHKGQESMLRKTWGYTCAENNGYAFIGKNGWMNYGIDATININRSTNGSASILLRVAKESWFPDQATPPFIGYEVRVDANGIRLLHCNYGEKELARLTFDDSVRDKVRIRLSAVSNRISINCGKNTLCYFDPDAHTNGKIGLQAKWEGFGFEKVDLTEDMPDA